MGPQGLSEARTLVERLESLVCQIPKPFLLPLCGLLLGTIRAATFRMMRDSGVHVPLVMEGEWSRDRLLGAKEVASILGVSINWVAARSDPRHPEYLDCTRRLSPRKLRYSENALRKWMRER